MLLEELLQKLVVSVYAFDRITVGNWWNYKNVNSPFTRLFYILDGYAEVKIDEEIVPMEPGTMVLTPPFKSVDYICEDYCDNYYMLFTAKLATGIELFSLRKSVWTQQAGKLTGALFERMSELNSDIGLKIVDPTDCSYNGKIMDMAESENDAAVLIETDGIIRMLIAEYLNNFDLVFRATGRSAERLIKVLHYIDKHLDRPITLQDLAVAASLHPNYLSDLFVKQVGERPISYITGRRISKAQLLLLTTGKMIKEIADETGFQDIDYFFRVFKQKVGITPGEYRDQMITNGKSHTTHIQN